MCSDYFQIQSTVSFLWMKKLSFTQQEETDYTLCHFKVLCWHVTKCGLDGRKILQFHYSNYKLDIPFILTIELLLIVSPCPSPNSINGGDVYCKAYVHVQYSNSACLSSSTLYAVLYYNQSRNIHFSGKNEIR